MTTLDVDTQTSAVSEPLYSLVYSSTATEPFDPDALEALLGHSRAANSASGITGMLLYRRGRFIQFLEGPERPVRDLLDRISADPRHVGVRVMLDGHPETRQFGEWTMGYERSTEPASPAPEGFRSSFDDLDDADDDVVLRATRELSLWFRVRAARS
ncbi:BLUF domain-containing protein [Planococcus sp. APC 4015]|nr:BLUF domain-containing protein [Planococcus sp. APC 4015]